MKAAMHMEPMAWAVQGRMGVHGRLPYCAHPLAGFPTNTLWHERPPLESVENQLCHFSSHNSCMPIGL